jgi:hypothetical protein
VSGVCPSLDSGDRLAGVDRYSAGGRERFLSRAIGQTRSGD